MPRPHAPNHSSPANIPSDAFATSFLGTSVGYLVLANVDSGIDHAMSLIGVGTFVGIALSFPAGMLADAFSTHTVLALVQLIQCLTVATLAISPSSMMFLVALTGAFALGRIVSPVRGALPPRYLPATEIIGYKTSLRTWTLTVALLGSATTAVVVAAQLQFSLCLLIIGLSCYVTCLGCTLMLPTVVAPGPERSALVGLGLSAHSWRIWWALLIGFTLASIPGALFAFLVARSGAHTSWLIFVASVLGIIINAVFARNSVRFSNAHGRVRKPYIFLAVALGLATSAVMIFLTLGTNSAHAFGFAAVMLTGVSIATIAELLLILVAWDEQYSAGSESKRSAIVALFSLSSSLGGSAGQYLSGRAYGEILRY